LKKACRVFIILFFVVCATVLVGCVTVPKTGNLKDSLRNESEKYWTLRTEGRYEDTYKMENDEGLPPFGKYVDILKQREKVNTTSRIIKDVNVTGDKGAVDMEITYVLPKIPKPFNQMVQDDWVYREGKWRHLLVPVQGTSSSGVTNK